MNKNTLNFCTFFEKGSSLTLKEKKVRIFTCISNQWSPLYNWLLCKWKRISSNILEEIEFLLSTQIKKKYTI